VEQCIRRDLDADPVVNQLAELLAHIRDAIAVG
jgi:hypothetical protein